MTKTNPNHEPDPRSAWLADFLLLHFQFCLRTFPSMLSDDGEDGNVSYATLRHWITRLKIKPTLRVEGLHRPVWGFHDFTKFVLAREMVRKNRLSLDAVGKFFSKSINSGKLPIFSTDNSGVAVVREDGSYRIFEGYNDSFASYLRDLEKAGSSHTTVNLSVIVDQAYERVMCWSIGKKYHVTTAKEFAQAMASVGHLIREVNTAAEALKK